MLRIKKGEARCLMCDKGPRRSSYKYCSNLCQQSFQYQLYIEKWKAGHYPGLSTMGTVTPPIKRYLREKYGDKCCLCGWSKKNLSTGIVPLVADHIDGNWRNNTEGNLRLLCPNCDALTPTFSALNKGRGRPNRAISKRAIEAKKLLVLKR